MSKRVFFIMIINHKNEDNRNFALEVATGHCCAEQKIGFKDEEDPEHNNLINFLSEYQFEEIHAFIMHNKPLTFSFVLYENSLEGRTSIFIDPLTKTMNEEFEELTDYYKIENIEMEKPIIERALSQKEIDTLLDKISAKGISSLTEKEKNSLSLSMK